jgi:flagellar biosynthetic protein FliQ
MNLMAEIDLIHLVRAALVEGGIVLLPALLAGFGVALIVGLLQSATGIHEPLVGMVPRLAVMLTVLFLAGGWMVERFVDLFQSSLLMP